MKKKLFLLAVIFLAIVNLAAFATLSYRKYCAMSESCPMNAKDASEKGTFCVRLNLSDSQIMELRRMSRAFHGRADSISAQISRKQLQLLELLDAENTNDEVIEKYVDEINSLQRVLQIEIIHYLQNQKKIMTPRQQMVFKDMLEKRIKKEMTNLKSAGVNFFESTCSHNLDNSKQCDTLNQTH